LDPNAASSRLDQAVKELALAGGGLYRIDREQLIELKPDFILAQAQCEVCAVSLADLNAALADVPGWRPEILCLSPTKLADVWTDMARVAEAFGAGERGGKVIRALKGRVADIIMKSTPIERRPTVACLEWLDPLMAAGNWVPELVELAGGKNLFGVAGQHSPWLDWNVVRQRNPGVIIAIPCGFDLARTQREMPALTRQLGWQQLQAVTQGRVFAADGSQYFNRPGPRLVESLEILAEILHPTQFQFGHEKRAWTSIKN